MSIQLAVDRVFAAKISAVKSLTEEVKEISFRLDKRFDFAPGQYVWVELPNLKTPDPKGNRRAFSICSTPNSESIISIVCRASLSGYKQQLFDLVEGDSVLVHGPFGSLHFSEKPETPVICVAGGVGIAPFMSLIPVSLAKVIERKITLVYANKAGRQGPYVAYFHELQAKYPNFKLIEVDGRIAPETLKEQNSAYPLAQWFVIGPKEFVFSVATTLFAEGVGQERLAFEEFFVSNESTKTLATQDKIQNLSIEFVMQQTNNHVVLTDANGCITFANQAAEKATGYSFSEMQGQTTRLWGGLQTPEFYKELWHKIKVERKPYSGQITNRKKNGELYDVICRISPFTDKEGNLLGFIGTEEDVTEEKQLRRHAEQLAIESEEKTKATLNVLEDVNIEKQKYDELFNNSLNGFADCQMIYDSTGQAVDFIYLHTNAAFTRLTGLSDVEGKKVSKIVPGIYDTNTDLFHCYARVAETGKAEQLITFIPQLNRWFNINAYGLQKGYFIAVFDDITKAREIDQMKTEFVSLASHQLRTPLTSIKWNLEALMNEKYGVLNEKQKGHLTEINSSNLRMIDLVNSLLNITRIESGRIIIDPVLTRIPEFIKEVLNRLKLQLEKKNISLDVNIDEGLPEVPLDQNLIYNVYQNFIKNSINYSKPGGRIILTIAAKDGQLISSVEDFGIGIPETEKQNIYNKFYRASTAVAAFPDGSGLGLYIVKAIVESSGGSVWFTTEEGKGSTFCFSLPFVGMKPKKGEVSLT